MAMAGWLDTKKWLNENGDVKVLDITELYCMIRLVFMNYEGSEEKEYVLSLLV